MSTHHRLTVPQLLTLAAVLTPALAAVLAVFAVLTIAGGAVCGLAFLALIAVLIGARLRLGRGSGRGIAVIAVAWVAVASVVMMLAAPWVPLALWDTLHRPTVHEWTTCDDGTLHERAQVDGEASLSVTNTGREC